MRRAAERGQALPLVALVLVLAAVAAVAVADLGAAAVHRARARTAADAAALAGAAEGEAAARAVAAANGADLVSFITDGLLVEVAVRHGPARATATAEGPPPLGVPAEVAPALAAALTRAAQVLGRTVPVVAVSEDGLVVEVDPAAVDALAAVAESAGLCRQPGATRPVHFVPCPSISPG